MTKWTSIAKEFPEHRVFLESEKSFRMMAKKDPSGRIIVQLFSDIIFTDNWSKNKLISKLARKSFRALNRHSEKSFIKHTYDPEIKIKVFMPINLIDHYEQLRKVFLKKCK